MDQVNILHVGRYWSEVLCCTITTHLGVLEFKVTDLEILCLSFCVLVDIYLKFFAVPYWVTSAATLYCDSLIYLDVIFV